MEEKKLKLYVVGESSGNPDDWCEYGGRSFVLAENSKQAESLAAFGQAFEVNAISPVRLFEIPLVGCE